MIPEQLTAALLKATLGSAVGRAGGLISDHIRGPKQQREFHAALRSAVARLSDRYPRLADVSADIDFFAAPDVVDYLFGFLVPGAGPDLKQLAADFAERYAAEELFDTSFQSVLVSLQSLLKEELADRHLLVSLITWRNTEETLSLLRQMLRMPTAVTPFSPASMDFPGAEPIPVYASASDVGRNPPVLPRTPASIPVHFGLPSLDSRIGLLGPGELLLLAGPLGLGKTSLALALSAHLALDSKTVAFFSLDLTDKQVVDRLISMIARVDGREMGLGRLSVDEFSAISAAASRLVSAPLFIDESADATLHHIQVRTRSLQSEYGCEVLVVDQIERLAHGRRVNSAMQSMSLNDASGDLYSLYQPLSEAWQAMVQALDEEQASLPQIAFTIANLKAIAGQLGVPAVATIDVDLMPRLNAQVADVILYLWQTRQDPGNGIVRANVIAANREFAPATVLRFESSLNRFRDLGEAADFEGSVPDIDRFESPKVHDDFMEWLYDNWPFEFEDAGTVAAYGTPGEYEEYLEYHRQPQSEDLLELPNTVELNEPMFACTKGCGRTDRVAYLAHELVGAGHHRGPDVDGQAETSRCPGPMRELQRTDAHAWKTPCKHPPFEPELREH